MPILPGRIFEVDDRDINIMEYPHSQYQNNYNNMLGALGGLGSQGGYSQANGYNNLPYTDEELAERQKRREEEEARMAEEQKQKDELRALNRPKIIRCAIGAIVSLAFAVFFFSMNMSFHNTDYNTSLASSGIWFLEVISAGSAVLLIALGRYYSK